MHRKSEALLSDILTFCDHIMAFTADATFDQYVQNAMLRHAVERNFQTLGEAMIRLQDADPDLAYSIENADQIVGLRHRLAHGYLTDIDNDILWDAATRDIPRLREQIVDLLDERER